MCFTPSRGSTRPIAVGSSASLCWFLGQSGGTVHSFAHSPTHPRCRGRGPVQGLGEGGREREGRGREGEGRAALAGPLPTHSHTRQQPGGPPRRCGDLKCPADPASALSFLSVPFRTFPTAFSRFAAARQARPLRTAPPRRCTPAATPRTPLPLLCASSTHNIHHHHLASSPPPHQLVD